MASAGWASILVAFLFLAASSTRVEASASGLFTASPIGVRFPSPPGYSTIQYTINQWNFTLSDNIMNHVISIHAYNGSFVDYMPLLQVNTTVGFTRNQYITLSGDTNAANVYQPAGPWGQGSTLALFLAKQIEGIWPFSQHYSVANSSNIDQITIALAGVQAWAGTSSVLTFACVGTCTPPVLP